MEFRPFNLRQPLGFVWGLSWDKAPSLRAQPCSKAPFFLRGSAKFTGVRQPGSPYGPLTCPTFPDRTLARGCGSCKTFGFKPA